MTPEYPEKTLWRAKTRKMTVNSGTQRIRATNTNNLN
jgi:hypothetical protein